MNHSALILCSFLIAVPPCAAEIKSAAPRSGLEPSEKSPPKPAAPTAPRPEKPADSRTPSANLLKDLALVEKIHAEPAKARETINRCGNLRNGLAAYPAYFQKLHSFWAIALANSGDMNAASEKFAIASSPKAPDQALATRALIEQVRFQLRNPLTVQKALDSVPGIISRTGENPVGRITVSYYGACALYLLGKFDESMASLKAIMATFATASASPDLAIMKTHASELLSALQAAKEAQNPDSAPHVSHAPWRPQEIIGGLGVNRRIAELAMIENNFPRALRLYTQLERDSVSAGQSEIRAWSRMQRARILYITGNPGEAEKILSTFITTSPFSEAKCAPYAVLRLGTLQHNYLNNPPQAEKTFDVCARKFRGTPEAAQAQFFRAVCPVMHGKSNEALPLLIAFCKDNPKQSETEYVKSQLIPAIEKEISQKNKKR